MSEVTKDHLLAALVKARGHVSDVHMAISDRHEAFPHTLHAAVEEAERQLASAYEAVAGIEEARFHESGANQGSPIRDDDPEVLYNDEGASGNHTRKGKEKVYEDDISTVTVRQQEEMNVLLRSIGNMTCPLKPKGLYTGEAVLEVKMSYSHAVLQCFAMILDPDILRNIICGDHFGPPSAFSDAWWKNSAIQHRAKQQKRYSFYVEAAVSEFLGALSRIRGASGENIENERENITPFFFQRAFSEANPGPGGSSKYPLDEERDPVEYTKDILNCLAVGRTYSTPLPQDTQKHVLIRALFQVNVNLDVTCPCGSQWRDSEQDWMITFMPKWPDETTEYSTFGLLTEFLEQ
jgi:hypothetical protein